MPDFLSQAAVRNVVAKPSPENGKSCSESGTTAGHFVPFSEQNGTNAQSTLFPPAAQSVPQEFLMRTLTATISRSRFEDAASLWLESKKPYISPRTYKDYAAYIKALTPTFQNLKLTDIYSDDIRKYQKERSKEVWAGKVNQECGCLMQMLRRIGRLPEIDYQPLPARRKSPGRAISPQESDRLFRVAQTRKQWEVAYLFAVLSINSTAGPKECFTLRLQDVDMRNDQHHIPHIRVQPEGAKNRNRERTIALNEAAYKAVDRLLELAREHGSWKSEHYLFPFRVKGNAYSGTYDPSRHCTTCKSAWKQLTEKASLPGLRPYDLRHTAITDLLEEADISEESIRAIAGHVSNEMFRIYSHTRLSAKRAALDAIFKKRSGSVGNPVQTFRKSGHR